MANYARWGWLRNELLSLQNSIDVVIFGRDQLRLHRVRDWLVAMISNCGRVLDAVWHYGSDAVGIHVRRSTHKFKGTWKMQVSIDLEK